MCVRRGTVCVMRTALDTSTRSVTGRCAHHPLLGPMTTSIDVLAQLRHEWRFTGATCDARQSLARFRTAHPELALDALVDLVDLVVLLEARSGRSVLERACIVRALLEEAADPLIVRTLIQTLLPGIVSVCRQLRFGDGIIDDPSETVTMAISLTSELLVEWAGQSRQYAAPDILSALRGRVRRWLLKEKAARRATLAHEPFDAPAGEESALLTRLEGLRGGQYDRLAALTYARVFEGRSLREVARHDNSSPATLQRELQNFAIHFLL